MLLTMIYRLLITLELLAVACVLIAFVSTMPELLTSEQSAYSSYTPLEMSLQFAGMLACCLAAVLATHYIFVRPIKTKLNA